VVRGGAVTFSTFNRATEWFANAMVSGGETFQFATED
jgi:hypothetical protein